MYPLPREPQIDPSSRILYENGYAWYLYKLSNTHHTTTGERWKSMESKIRIHSRPSQVLSDDYEFGHKTWIIVYKLNLYINSNIDNCSSTKFKSRLKQETTLLVVSGWQYNEFLKYWL